MFLKITVGQWTSISGNSIIVPQQNILGEGLHAASTPLSGEFAEPVSSLSVIGSIWTAFGHHAAIILRYHGLVGKGLVAGVPPGAAVVGVIEWCHFRPFVRQHAALSRDWCRRAGFAASAQMDWYYSPAGIKMEWLLSYSIRGLVSRRKSPMSLIMRAFHDCHVNLVVWCHKQDAGPKLCICEKNKACL